MLPGKRRLLYRSMFGKNNFLLTLAIIYGLLAIVQANINGLFETKFYHSIAFISFTITGCESIRSITKCILQYTRSIDSIMAIRRREIMKHINVFSEYTFLSDEINDFQKIINEKEKKQKNKFWNLLFYFNSALPFIEVFLVVSIILIFPLLNPPDNLNNAKIVNAMSLATLAFAFISIYCNDYVANDLKQADERIALETMCSNYYLNIIKKISMYQKNNNANEDKEFNDNEK